MRRNGFTLVEVSIVLVILGLLVGGVLTGRSLIHAAELRSITAERNQYVTVAVAFKEKYKYLPGDMMTATRYWGQLGSCGDVATDMRTCDGDGDGRVYAGYERYRFWQHLTNAGLIEGTYAGVNDAPGGSVRGWNVPAAKWKKAAWGADYIEEVPAPGTALMSPGRYGNFLSFGATEPDEPMVAYGVIAAEDAKNIDSKTDDGNPIQGSVRATKNQVELAPECLNGTEEEYNVANSRADACGLFFMDVF